MRAAVAAVGACVFWGCGCGAGTAPDAETRSADVDDDACWPNAGGDGFAVWTEVTPTASPPRHAFPAMAYDSDRGRAVMLSVDEGGTWEYDGAAWSEIASASRPPEGFGHALAYDAGRRRTVLFGTGFECGSFSCYMAAMRIGVTPNLGVLWEYSGVTWVETTSEPAPPGRNHYAVAYDVVRGRLVVYGGIGSGGQGGGSPLADTWEYDGVGWVETTPALSPPHRLGEMVYDAASERMVLFGGYNGETYVNDTWEYDGAGWVETTPAVSPPARELYGMAYDSHRGRVVMFGGLGRDGRRADTWEYDGCSWTETTAAVAPAPRHGHVMVYDAGRRRVVLFGGEDLPGEVGDTWEYGVP